MILAYIVFGLILIKTIVEIKNAIIAKKYTQLFSTLFYLPFFVRLPIIILLKEPMPLIADKYIQFPGLLIYR
jgi:hypothetical protein